jgi:hypothetical protein
MRIYAYIAALAAVLGVVWFVYDQGEKAGRNACETEHTNAANTAQKEIDRREVASSDASESMLDYLRANLPPIEVQANEAVERVRTIYRDRPVPAGSCVRPDGVQGELDAARERANTAARGLQHAAYGDAATRPAADVDGRMGPAGDGHL